MARTTPLALGQTATTTGDIAIGVGNALLRLIAPAGVNVPRQTNIGIIAVDANGNAEPLGYLSPLKDNGTFFWPGPAMNVRLVRPDLTPFGVDVGVEMDN